MAGIFPNGVFFWFHRCVCVLDRKVMSYLLYNHPLCCLLFLWKVAVYTDESFESFVLVPRRVV